MKNKQGNTNWLTSKEAQKVLKVSGCKLMHLRVSGKLTFKKQGNAFYYRIVQSDSNKTF